MSPARSPACWHVQVQLKGHRSVGGMRASVYNSMPMSGAHALATFMQACACSACFFVHGTHASKRAGWHAMLHGDGLGLAMCCCIYASMSEGGHLCMCAGVCLTALRRVARRAVLPP